MAHQIPAQDIDEAIIACLTTEPRQALSIAELKRLIAGRFPPVFTPLSRNRIGSRLSHLREHKRVMIDSFDKRGSPAEWRLYPDLADVLPGALRQVIAGLLESRAIDWANCCSADDQIAYAQSVLSQGLFARETGDRHAVRDLAIEVASRLIDAANTIDAEIAAALEAETMPF